MARLASREGVPDDKGDGAIYRLFAVGQKWESKSAKPLSLLA